MWRRLIVLLLPLNLLSACNDAVPKDAVILQSVNYDDFRQLISGAAPSSTATVTATLRFPDEARDRYPALVIVHTIGGYQESNEGWHAAEFRKAGYATLTYDSFASRGLSERTVVSARDGPPIASALADAFAALHMLSQRPKIDPRRIAIVGFSFGGEIAHLAAFTRLQSLLGAGQRFAAHVAYYPGGTYGVVAAPNAYTGAPVLMLLGEKDDNLPVTKVRDYVGYANEAGHPAPIEMIVYPTAYHAWTVSDLGSPRFYPQYGSTKKCPLILFGSAGPSFLTGDRLKPFDPTVLDACRSEGPGYTMGYDAAVRTQSTADAEQFLKRTLAE